MNSPEIDMEKVKRAVRLYGGYKPAPDHRIYPPAPSPVAQDAAIRKPLRAHGHPCRSGFNCRAFLNND